MELLVVLGVIGLILGISVPSLVEYGQRVRLKTATRNVMGYLSLARSQAISGRTEREVVVDDEHGELRMLDPSSGEDAEDPLRLPGNLSVALLSGGEPASEGSFTFRSTGALQGRSMVIRLDDGQRQRTITVTGATGAVSLE